MEEYLETPPEFRPRVTKPLQLSQEYIDLCRGGTSEPEFGDWREELEHMAEQGKRP